jgi:hypothetical protein
VDRSRAATDVKLTPLRIAAIACALVVSLGLPWGFQGGTASSIIPGYYTPGFCTTVYDNDGYAFTECSPGWVGAPIFMPGVSGAYTPGAKHAARFGIAFGLVACALALRKGRRRILLVAGIVLFAVSVPTAGLVTASSGALIGYVAAGAMVLGGIGRTRAA